MENLKKFMVVHHEPDVRWATVEANWGKLAMVESAKWSRPISTARPGAAIAYGWLQTKKN